MNRSAWLADRTGWWSDSVTGGSRGVYGLPATALPGRQQMAATSKLALVRNGGGGTPGRREFDGAVELQGMASEATIVEAGGRDLRVTSGDRVIFPATERSAAVTKLDIVNYYLAVEDGIMRALCAPADDARALAEGRAPGDRAVDPRAARRRRLLPEARAEGRARLRRDRADRSSPPAATPTRSARPRSRSSAGRRRWGRSRSTPGRCATPTSTIPTSCASTSTRSRAPTSRDAVRVAAEARDAARRARLHRLPEDLGRPRRAHLRADRAALELHRRAPRGDRVRPRARAAAARTRSPRSGGRRSAASASSSTTTRTPATARSPRPTRSGRSRARRSRRRWTGTSCPTSRPRTSRSPRCRRASPRSATATRRSTTPPTRWSRCCEMYERDEAGDMPYPPDYPKMPGEPKRVQPSRDTDRPR